MNLNLYDRSDGGLADMATGNKLDKFVIEVIPLIIHVIGGLIRQSGKENLELGFHFSHGLLAS